ncbi:ABC-2 type transporter [Pyrolobus fumarii 1A]|uniref:ABC-2 type transporter n=1 Tax=Pyrolobus fumarii (strain DSM 11204 / 1A) TaxID=694429 RepID=G0EH69_PYRF1|nr:ABC-2 type transporter [Pyrolobus fumarii]AEM39293.1 ABC-2 type transporter [Pyrolobus fumarii 1A]
MRTSLSNLLAPVARGVLAGAFDYITYYRRRKTALIAALTWPLLYTAFLVLVLLFTGASNEYARRMGVGEELASFIPAASFLLTAIGYIVDGAALYVLGLRWNGVLQLFMATPGALLRLLTGCSIGSMLAATTVVIVPFILVTLIVAGVRGLVVLLIVVLISLLAGFSMIGLGALVAGATLASNRERVPLQWLLPFTVLASSILYPPVVLPPLLRAIAKLLPPYYAAEALRSIASTLSAKPLLSILLTLAPLAAAYATLYVPASLLVQQARRRGSLE